ncbi:TPA: thymidine kinase [Bacillus cereus]
MAKVYFRYGTMDSSKTMRLITDAYDYTSRGEFVLPIKSVSDTRSQKGKIESRTGLSIDCLDVDKDYHIYGHIGMLVKNGVEVSCVFVDEAQFLTSAQVLQLRLIANHFDIPVMCYGLKTDFRGNMFEGSQSLFIHANRLEEVKTMCREVGCKHKAMFNVRYFDGKPTFEGEQVQVGDTKVEEKAYYYIPKCSAHFLENFESHLKEEGVVQ